MVPLHEQRIEINGLVPVRGGFLKQRLSGR
jgi:hypothetical protein